MKKANLQKSGMVDVGDKPVTRRTALAMARVTFSAQAFAQLRKGGSPKGDVFETAKLAGIMAAKRTAETIPLCHSLALDSVRVSFEFIPSAKSVDVLVEVVSHGRTGVEMEALCAASTAALTIYDMMKWLGQTMTIGPIRLLEKTGGASGDFLRTRSGHAR